MRRDVPSLRTVPIVRELERSFRLARARPGFRLVHYSLQGNHAHLIVEARDRDMLGRGMKAVGARIARAVNRVAGRTGPVLADRYHLRLLPTPKDARNALRYVLLNARRHTAPAHTTLRKTVRLDPASSAHWFNGWKSGTETLDGGRQSNSPTRTPVARARTWLLSVGWRRHGLIDPADVRDDAEIPATRGEAPQPDQPLTGELHPGDSSNTLGAVDDPTRRRITSWHASFGSKL
jgi:hypothetical protein